jgi:hypothetical protein
MTGQPGSVARAIVGLAVETLPAEHRNRYENEFLAELSYIPAPEQRRYALRVLAGSWTLRNALHDQPMPTEEVVIMGRPLRCRLRMHAWRVRHNEEDATPYEQCARCHAERDTQLKYLAGFN